MLDEGEHIQLDKADEVDEDDEFVVLDDNEHLDNEIIDEIEVDYIGEVAGVMDDDEVEVVQVEFETELNDENE